MNGTGEGIATDQISSFLFHQFDALERDAYKVLQSIRSWRNRSAPINRIPPEILSLIPHFWKSPYSRDQDVITLTHVCQAWRDVFVSCPSLWTYLCCRDLDKTRVYLERSRSSPVTTQRPYVSLRSLLQVHPSHCWTTQISEHRWRVGTSPRHQRVPILPCSPSRRVVDTW